jgi:serine O-acetyltransferase
MAFWQVPHALHAHGHRRMARSAALLIRVVTGATIPAEVALPASTKVAYGGSGLVVHPRVRLGENCLLSPGVVLGGRAGHWEVPILEDNVQVSPGAKILGPVRIGFGAVIGANAVVIHDVAAGQTVVASLGRILDVRPDGRVGSHDEQVGS